MLLQERPSRRRLAALGPGASCLYSALTILCPGARATTPRRHLSSAVPTAARLCRLRPARYGHAHSGRLRSLCARPHRILRRTIHVLSRRVCAATMSERARGFGSPARARWQAASFAPVLCHAQPRGRPRVRAGAPAFRPVLQHAKSTSAPTEPAGPAVALCAAPDLPGEAKAARARPAVR